MRNYICLIVTFVLLFCLGCGSAETMNGNGAPKEPYPNASSDSETSVSEDVLDASDEESVQGNETEDKKTESINIEETEYVAVRTEHIYEEYVDRETGNPLVEMNYHSLSLEEGNETLKQSVSKWMVKRQQDLEEDGLELMVKAKSKQKEMENPNLTASLWHEITLYRSDACLISFVDRQYTYGIDTWNNDYRCVNFDIKSGKNLLLHDLLVDKEAFRTTVIDYFIDVLENMYTNSAIDETVVTEMYQSITSIGNWCLDASGFVFVYEDDELEYSNEGVLFVHIPYDIVREYINPAYLWGNAHGIAALAYNQSATILMDGKVQEIRVEKQYDTYDMEQSKIIYGDEMMDVSQHMRTNNMYLVNHEKWKYVIMTVDMASEDYQTYFYPLTADGIGKVFAINGGLDAANVRTDSFDLAFRIDVFGTYRTYPEYVIVENGTIGAYRVEYQVHHTNYEYCELVTIRELPVRKDSEQMLLPVGSRMRILSTDNDSWAKFLVLDTMEEVVVEFVREENYTLSVNGISEYEYFEELPYAG